MRRNYSAAPLRLLNNRNSCIQYSSSSVSMATKAAIKDFEVEELCDFLSSSGELSEEAIGKFRSNRISGGIFFDLDDADLKELLPILGDRKVIQRIIKSYQPPSQTVSISVRLVAYFFIIKDIFSLQLPRHARKPMSLIYRGYLLAFLIIFQEGQGQGLRREC